MEKETYIVINGVKYYPAHKKNVIACVFCSFYDDDKCDCKLEKIGIMCGKNSYFVKEWITNKIMKKEFYFIINGIRYYPVRQENVLSCERCAFYNGNDNCITKNKGIKCVQGFHFVKE